MYSSTSVRSKLRPTGTAEASSSLDGRISVRATSRIMNAGIPFSDESPRMLNFLTARRRCWPPSCRALYTLP
ncbi:hypothetical protein EYF80_003715 [Liparis tanakae]|uniref:Uncharacterized protein n=1 Tax=Liparis tanakae TaxID=230148 RepID=A0A4Z2J7E3_9TELE|nr:hypothetical protein EYF80_003715 [Liparis tanakae]